MNAADAEGEFKQQFIFEDRLYIVNILDKSKQYGMRVAQWYMQPRIKNLYMRP